MASVSLSPAAAGVSAGSVTAGDPVSAVTRGIEQARRLKIRWVVVGMHKNCISAGPYYCDVFQDLFSTLIEEISVTFLPQFLGAFPKALSPLGALA